MAFTIPYYSSLVQVGLECNSWKDPKEKVIIIGTNGYGQGLADPMQLNYLIGRHRIYSTLAGGTELSVILSNIEITL